MRGGNFLLLLVFTWFSAAGARADLFGGDDAILAQILVQAIQQLSALNNILSTGSDTLGLLRDINQGLRDGLAVIGVQDPRLGPGLYGSLDSADQVLSAVHDLYGPAPDTGEARIQQTHDQAVAESIAMNGTLFHYADEADHESQRILEHAQLVNPTGAGKLTAQSVAVLIGVTAQVLRTNSMMLKMMAENLAIENRKEKVASSQFKTQYDSLSSALGSVPTITKLPRLEGGGE